MALGDVAQQIESPKDFGTDDAAKAQLWISELTLAEKDQAPYRKRGRDITKIYKGQEALAAKARKFALLWSNMETLSPAVYAKTPTAVVGRRYKDNDPVGRIASEVLERGLNFSLDNIDFADVMLGLRTDYLLLAQGQAWVRYVPKMQTETPDGDGDVEQASNGEVSEGAEPYEVVAWEEVVADHVSWDDFLHNVARKWSEVRWVARTVYMTRAELIDRFGKEIGNKVPLDHGPSESSYQRTDQSEQFAKAAIYEIMDKATRKAIWISKNYPESPLDERPDPLGLKDFFPCPRPLLGTCAPDSLIPTPDYDRYEGQARDIDVLTRRIGLLMDALKLRGFYAAGGEQKDKLQDLLTSETNTLIPVDSWAGYAERGGVKGLIEWLPIKDVVDALTGCITARKQLIDDVYQVTGIADIMRGDTDPNETASAQKLKANWGSSRVRDKQKEMARFARDVLRIMGQVIATKFDPKTLGAMTNIQLFETDAQKQQVQQQLQMQAQMAAQQAQAMGQPPQQPQVPPQLAEMLGKPSWEEVCGLLRDDTLRGFRIDVEADSTIEPNDQEEKQSWVEFVTAISELMAKSLPLVQLEPKMIPMVAELVKATVRKYRVGRESEEVIDQCMDQLLQGAGQGAGQQQGGPNPQAEQAKAQAAQTNAQANMVKAQVSGQHVQVEQAKLQSQHQIGMAQIQAENNRTQAGIHSDQAMHGQSLQADLQQAVIKAEERQLVHQINSQKPLAAPTQ